PALLRRAAVVELDQPQIGAGAKRCRYSPARRNVGQTLRRGTLRQKYVACFIKRAGHRQPIGIPLSNQLEAEIEPAVAQEMAIKLRLVRLGALVLDDEWFGLQKKRVGDRFADCLVDLPGRVPRVHAKAQRKGIVGASELVLIPQEREFAFLGGSGYRQAQKHHKSGYPLPRKHGNPSS